MYMYCEEGNGIFCIDVIILDYLDILSRPT